VLKVNCRDGRTLTFDLLDDRGHEDWLRYQRDLNFQSQITAAGILHDGTLHALPLPAGFRHPVFEADVLTRANGGGEQRVAGEWLACYADQVKFTLTVYYGTRPKVVRFSGAKVGKMRYNPAIHGPVKEGDRQ